MLRNILVLVLLCVAVVLAQVEPVKPIESLDVARYMGRWFEISRYKNSFQNKCVASAQADYSLRKDGKVTVVNQCLTETGEMSIAKGVARQVGPSTSAKLEVSFAPEWTHFLPFVWGDYWVVDLDKDYSLAAVSEPKREFLWVLSRTPKVDPAQYEALLARLAKQGFDLSKLITSRLN